jgi:hypothetical protein
MASRNKMIDWMSIYQNKLNLIKRGDKYVSLCPYHNEKTPSFYIFSNGGFKCFGCGESGNINKFIEDFNISDIKTTDKLPIIIEKQQTLIEFSDKPFEDIHKAYWNKYLLPEEYLKNRGVYAVKSWAINGKLQKMDNNIPVFAYYDAKYDVVKILRIGVDKKDKWRTSAPNTHIWYKPIEKCKQLWISKSIKDSLCAEYHFEFCSCAVQNEDAKILDRSMPELLTLGEEIVLNFGADPMGVINCKIIQEKYNTKYWNTPRYCLKYGIQDMSDMIDQFGVEIVRKQLIRKGYLNNKNDKIYN